MTRSARALAATALVLACVAITGAFGGGGGAAAAEGAAQGDAAGAAPAARPAPPIDRRAQRRVLARALALVTPELAGAARLTLAPPRAGVRAQFDSGTGAITVFADPTDTPHRVAHDIAHELGHAWDAARLDDAARRAYLRGRGAPDAPWWPASTGADDYTSGAGDFAEVFARCHAASPEFRSRLAPAPADACAALPAAARSAA